MFDILDPYGTSRGSLMYAEPSIVPDFQSPFEKSEPITYERPQDKKQKLDNGQSGSGFFDSVRNFPNVVNKIMNVMPDGDNTARPGFPGEKHQILKLSNGKYGRANYSGPGTRIGERLVRGDPPRTLTDKVAQAHDIRYSFAQSQNDIYNADSKFINKLSQIERAGTDAPFNTKLARTLITGKMALEKSGLAKSGQIASFGGVAKGDIDNPQQRKAKLQELEQQGFGLLPGDKLKLKLLAKQLKKKPRDRGVVKPMSGTGKKSDARAIAKVVSITKMMMPKMLDVMHNKNLTKFPQLGSGVMDILGDVMRSKLTQNIKFKEYEIKQKARAIARIISPILLPVIIKLLKSSKHISIGKLKSEIEMALTNGFVHLGSDQSGSGLFGKSSKWWSEFGKGFLKGFKMVAKPAASVLGPVLTATGSPEFGIPLTIAGTAL